MSSFHVKFVQTDGRTDRQTINGKKIFLSPPPPPQSFDMGA